MPWWPGWSSAYRSERGAHNRAGFEQDHGKRLLREDVRLRNEKLLKKEVHPEKEVRRRRFPQNLSDGSESSGLTMPSLTAEPSSHTHISRRPGSCSLPFILMKRGPRTRFSSIHPEAWSEEIICP